MGDAFRSLLRRVSRRVSGTRDDGAEQSTPSRERDSAETDALSADCPTRRDVVRETGLTPEEYLLQKLRAEGGEIRQQDLCDWTDWSESSVSRQLTEMEEEGLIVRLRIGREKIVRLPEEGSPGRTADAGT